MKIIFLNELKLYLFSWLGWLALIMINIVAGLGVISGISQYGLYTQLFYLVEMPIVWAILIIGARSLSKDRELGLFSLFFTSPLKLDYLFFGKFFALVAFFLIALMGIIFYPLIASLMIPISWISIFSGILALVLQICLFSSISIFASSFSSNTLISIVIGFAVWIILNLLGSVTGMLDPNSSLTDLLKNLSYSHHFNNINSGNFSITNILYFVIGSLFFIKLAESRILVQIAR